MSQNPPLKGWVLLRIRSAGCRPCGFPPPAVQAVGLHGRRFLAELAKPVDFLADLPKPVDFLADLPKP